MVAPIAKILNMVRTARSYYNSEASDRNRNSH
jgi:hypothetical protein